MFTQDSHVVVSLPAAYKEKMKELSVLSIICSCFYPEARKKFVQEFAGTALILSGALQIHTLEIIVGHAY